MLLGTAGHVDHGKTTLVRALTGVECDRLAEERRRGITIELGFARWELPGGQVASVVDVPGHEKLVRTMLVGAGGVQGVLLVVSAAAGVMPQTREHLAACGLLGVRDGVVAVTFADRVSDLDGVLAAIAAELVDSPLAHAERIPVCAPTGEGLEALTAAVGRLADRLPPLDAARPACLPVDRVFTVGGFGTVVTGSLVQGALSVGQPVALVPGPDRVRVKGLQIHGEAAQRVGPGVRVAVNLACERSAVPRGAVLCAPGEIHLGRVFDAEVEWLPHNLKPLHRLRGVSLHLGGARAVADVRVDSPLEPGGRGTARVRLDRSVALPAGARFVLRGAPDPRRGAVLGGGRVLDAEPPRRRAVTVRVALAVASPSAAVELVVAEAGARGVAAEALAVRLPVQARRGPRLFSAAAVAQAEAALRSQVLAWHARRPQDPGLPLVEAGDAPVQRLARARLEAAGEILREGTVLRAPAHRALLSEADQALGRKLMRAIGRAGLSALRLRELEARFPAPNERIHEVLAYLEMRDRVVRVGELWFAGRELYALRRVVARGVLAGPVSVAWFKQAAGITRRHAIPLLTWLDDAGVTTRRGDVRVAGPRAAELAEEGPQ